MSSPAGGDATPPPQTTFTMKKKPRVAVLMSGGVDSSVAAGLLKEAGYEVIGFTLQLWPAFAKLTRRSFSEGGASAGKPAEKEPGGCCGLSAIEDAKKVARILDVPHYVLNCRKIFREEIIDYFCQTYLFGRTPNPCIMCNRRIKFDYFLKKAQEISADYVASGHYARITRKGTHYFLKKGVDTKYDQSYFLYNLTREQLSAVLFPLGGFTKEEVRKKASSFGFPNAGKKSSQEICFIPDNDYGRFIRDRIPEAATPGPIFSPEGKLLGQHKGIAFYTVGQREGLGISLPRPLYVVEIDPGRNALIVAEKEAVYRKELLASDLNWIGEQPFGKFQLPPSPLRGEDKGEGDKKRNSYAIKVTAKIRYRNPETLVRIEPLNEMIRVKFRKPQFAVTPGQSIVFYRRGTVLGGGVISG